MMSRERSGLDESHDAGHQALIGFIQMPCLHGAVSMSQAPADACAHNTPEARDRHHLGERDQERGEKSRLRKRAAQLCLVSRYMTQLCMIKVRPFEASHQSRSAPAFRGGPGRKIAASGSKVDSKSFPQEAREPMLPGGSSGGSAKSFPASPRKHGTGII